jgi:hypothetical protein
VQVVYRILSSIDDKLKQSAAEREARKKFDIRYSSEGMGGASLKGRDGVQREE